jgi:integrase
MKGHIRQRSPGRWAIILDTRDETNKRKRKWHSFQGTKRQAQLECARLIAAQQGGPLVEPSKSTLAQYLEHWLRHMASQVSPQSLATYNLVAETHLIPALGTITLNKLAPVAIAKAYSNALERRHRNGSGLAPTTVRLMHRVLSQALKQAVVWRILAQNPATLVKPPRIERKQMKVLDLTATLTLIEFARTAGDIFIPVLLCALCGLRRGEATALRWRAVNLETAQLSVEIIHEQTAQGLREKPPKNGIPRTIALSAVVVEELRRHRLRQAEDLLRLGQRQTNDTHLCLRAAGEFWTPRSFTLKFIQLIRRSELPRIRLHDLRHAHATHLLTTNIHPKVVQERLGHASIRMTLDLYSHVLPGMQENAAADLDVAIRAAMQKVAKR